MLFVVVLDEFLLLNLVVNVVDDLSQCSSCCQCSSQCCCSIFLSMLLSKTSLWNNFCQQCLMNSLLSTMLFSMLFCLWFYLMLRTMLSLTSANSILILSGLVVELVVVHMFDANFVLNNSALTMFFVLCLLDIEDTLGVERLVVHSLVVRSCCSQHCSPYFVASFIFLLIIVVVVAVGSINPWVVGCCSASPGVVVDDATVHLHPVRQSIVVVAVTNLLGHQSSKCLVVIDVAAHLQRICCC